MRIGWKLHGRLRAACDPPLPRHRCGGIAAVAASPVGWRRWRRRHQPWRWLLRPRLLRPHWLVSQPVDGIAGHVHQPVEGVVVLHHGEVVRWWFEVGCERCALPPRRLLGCYNISGCYNRLRQARAAWGEKGVPINWIQSYIKRQAVAVG